MRQILPWQQRQWAQLQEARAADRIPHALLLVGPEKTGKRLFAEAFAQGLLCQAPSSSGVACGNCASCRLLEAGNHSDLAFLEPEEAGKAIKIDAVREFTGSESLSSQFGGYKIRVIEPADAMNLAASNALLKTLEEPTPSTLLVLVSSRPGALPATIRSRCQTLGFPLPERTTSLAWLAGQGERDWETLLALAAGAPLRALALAEEGVLEARTLMLGELFALLDGRTDPIRVAADWAARDSEQLLGWFGAVLSDILRLQVMDSATARFNPDVEERLRQLARRKPALAWQRVMAVLIEVRKSITRQLNLQLQLENLLIEWVGVPDHGRGGR